MVENSFFPPIVVIIFVFWSHYLVLYHFSLCKNIYWYTIMLMSKEVIGLIAVGLVFIAYIPYIRDILRNKVKPHPFSWFVWGITASSIFMLQTANGSGSGAYTTATVAVFAFSVFFLSYKRSKVKIKPLDIICLSIALTGVGLWLFVDNPVLSILILLVVELTGFIPTVVKGWRKPYDDSITLWGTNSMRHLAGFFAIQQYNFVTMLNPIVWGTLSLAFSGVMFLRRRKFVKWPWRKREFRPFN